MWQDKRTEKKGVKRGEHDAVFVNRQELRWVMMARSDKTTRHRESVICYRTFVR